ncbi:MAG: hypothetical protein ACKOX6_17995 [Bdellovibrio sp.]
MTKNNLIKWSLHTLVCGSLMQATSGCSSTPVKVSQAKYVTSDRVLGMPRTMSTVPANIAVVCDKGLGAMALLLKVDGKEIAKIYSGEKIEFKLDPGAHIFGVKMWEGTNVEIESTVRESENAFYRILIPGYGVTIQKSAEIGKL